MEENQLMMPMFDKVGTVYLYEFRYGCDPYVKEMTGTLYRYNRKRRSRFIRVDDAYVTPFTKEENRKYYCSDVEGDAFGDMVVWFYEQNLNKVIDIFAEKLIDKTYAMQRKVWVMGNKIEHLLGQKTLEADESTQIQATCSWPFLTSRQKRDLLDIKQRRGYITLGDCKLHIGQSVTISDFDVLVNILELEEKTGGNE